MRHLGKRDRKLTGRHSIASVVPDRDRPSLDALADVDQFGALEPAPPVAIRRA